MEQERILVLHTSNSLKKKKLIRVHLMTGLCSHSPNKSDQNPIQSKTFLDAQFITNLEFSRLVLFPYISYKFDLRIEPFDLSLYLTYTNFWKTRARTHTYHRRLSHSRPPTVCEKSPISLTK